MAIIILSVGQLTAQTVTLNPASLSPWQVPAGVTSINVQAWGGGGAGGGAGNLTHNGGSGGGSGGYSQSNNIAVTPSQNIFFAVGNGGVGSADANGSAGGATSIATLGITTNGGLGGQRRGGAAGAGGTASGGTTNINGNIGIVGNGSSAGKGGDAPSGGTGGNGNNGNGFPGIAPGGGGGGGRATGFTARSGGNGGSGQIIITYVLPTLSSIPSPICANSTIVLNGTNFFAPISVTFNGVAASTVTIISPTQLQVVVPAAATTGNIRVTTGTGFTTNPGIAVVNNPLLGGPSAVCEGSSINVTPSSGGTWLSSNTAIATVDNTGLVNAIAPGSVVLTYTDTATGCQATKNITVNPLPVINSQPSSQSVCTGSVVTFSVGAAVSGLAYQWYNGATPVADGGNISGATTATLTFNTVTVANASADYHCVVSGVCTPSVTSNSVSLAVNERITITTQPLATQTVCAGTSVTLSVTATGDSPTYQWYNGAFPMADGGNISGSTTNTLTLNPVSTGDASANYYVVVSGVGACLPATSSTAVLIVNEIPIIQSQPEPLNTVCDEDPVSLSILATGGSLTYQWYKGGVPVVDGGNISGSQTDTLNFVPVFVANAATDYYCVVTNSCTSVSSTLANVVVNLKPKVPAVQSATTCSDTGFSVSYTSGVPTPATFIPAGTTYAWPAPIVTGGMTGGAADSGQPTIFGTLNNPTNTPQTATYTVTPTSGTTGFCVGNPFTLTVTVNPVPDIANMNASVCSGEVLTITPTNGAGNIVPAGTTYSWGLPSVTGGLTGATTGVAAASFSQTLINPTNLPQTATYNITATSGSCLGATFTVIVTVNPKPTIGVSLASQSVCSGIAFTPVTFSNPNNVPGTVTYNWTRDNNAIVSGLPASGTGTITGTLSHATAVPQTVTFTIYAYSDEGCISLAGTTTVTVSPNPVVNPVSNQTICSGNNITAVNLSASIVGTTFSWTRNNTANITGIPDSSGNVISGSLTNLTNTPQTTVFTITPSAAGCSSISNAITFSVTVNPATAANAAPATQTVCGGEAFTITASELNGVVGTTYSFTKDSTVAGDAVSLTGNTISGSLENNSGVDRIVTFTITATANTCPSTTTVTVTVKPNPAFTLTPSSQSICNSGAITTINFPAVPGVTYSWVRTNPLAAGNLSGMPDSDVNATSISGTLTNLTSVNQTTTFTVTATINGCSKTRTVTVIVYSSLTSPIISETQTVCAGSRPTPLVMTTLPGGGSGTYTYQWQSAPDVLPLVWTNIPGATGPSYWPPTTNGATPTTHYQLIVSNVCGTLPPSNDVIVDVANNLNFTFSTSGGSTTLCSGAAWNPTIESGQFLPNNYIRYTWTADVNYITPSTGGPITGAITYWPAPWLPIWVTSSATLPMSVVNNTGANVTTTVFITPTIYNSSTNLPICALSPQQVTVTIRPRPTVTITSPTNGQLICSATSAGVTAVSSMTGTFTVTRAPNASVSSSATFPIVSGSIAAGVPYSFTDNLTNNTASTQPVVYTITPTSTAGCPGLPQTITINIAPQLLPGSIGTNHTVCAGGDPNLITETVAATSATSYSWEYSINGTTWLPIAGANGTTYDPPGPLTQTTWYRRVVSSSVSGIPCSVAVTTPVIVTVNTLTAGSIGSDQTICSGGGPVTINSIAPGTGLATLSYQWQSNVAGCGSPFTDIVGANAINYVVPAGLATTTYFRRLTKSSAGTCEIASNCVTIYVNNVTGGSVGNDENLCNTTNPSAFTELSAASGSGTLSYQWQSTTNAAGCASAPGAWTNIAFATGATYDPPAGVVTTTWYRRVTTSTLNGVQCTAVSNCITITANSVTAGTISPNSRTICSGGDPAAFNSTSPGSGTGLTYQWQSSPTGAAGTWVDIAGATGLNYDPVGPITTTTYYRRVAIGTVGAATCQATTTLVTVYVNDVTAPVMAGDQNVCSEDPAAFTITTPATGAGVLSYQWQSNTTGCGGAWVNIPGATGATYDAPPFGVTTYYRVVVTSTLNAVQCTAISNCLNITSFAKVWNGSVSNDWNTANNWTPTGVPTSSHCVVVPNVSPWHCVVSGSNYIGYAHDITVLNGGILEINPSNSIVATDRVAVNAGGTFNILNSANLVQVNNVPNIGTVNMFRITQPMYRFDYTYWNSPMVMGSYTLGNLSQNLTQFDKYYSWNPSISGGNGGWVQESAATIMNPAKGYIVRAPNTFSFTPTVFQPYTAIFTGTPNNGDIQVPITVGSLGPGTTYDKLNLIGNPFASAVSALAFVNDPANVPLVDGTLYFWTHNAPPSAAFPNPFYGSFQINYSPNGYASLNALGGTSTVPAGYGGPTPIDNIAAGQSFFIVGKTSGTAFFRNSMRRTGDNSAFFRLNNPYVSAPTTFESHRIWLNMADTQGSFSQILVGYAEGATNGHDRNFDGETFNSGGISLYSINGDRKYGIQGRTLPFDVNDVVPLGYNSTVARDFTIGIDHLDGLFENQNVYLEDRLLNVIHDIKQSPYTFTAEIGVFNDRFLLRYTNESLGVNNPDASVGLVAFITDKKLHIRADRDIESVQIYDLSGKLIRTYLPSDASHQLDTEFVFAQGVYFAKIKLLDGIVVTSKLSNGN